MKASCFLKTTDTIEEGEEASTNEANEEETESTDEPKYKETVGKCKRENDGDVDWSLYTHHDDAQDLEACRVLCEESSNCVAYSAQYPFSNCGTWGKNPAANYAGDGSRTWACFINTKENDYVPAEVTVTFILKNRLCINKEY